MTKVATRDLLGIGRGALVLLGGAHCSPIGWELKVKPKDSGTAERELSKQKVFVTLAPRTERTQNNQSQKRKRDITSDYTEIKD